MRIEAIEVEGLFGTFNHKIPLNLDDRITIIHGPNGFGKTVLLEMVYNLFQGDFEQILQIPFSRLWIRLTGNQALEVVTDSMPAQRDLFHAGEKARIFLRIGLFEDGERKEALLVPDWTLGREDLVRSPLSSAVEMNLSEANRRLIDTTLALTRGDLLESPPVKLADWWRELAAGIRVGMIHEHRRLDIETPSRSSSKRRRPRWVPVVTQYAQELAALIEDRLAESAELSQSLDRTFPNRLIERIGRHRHPNGNLKNELKELEDKRERLQAVGLLDAQQEAGFLNPPPDLGDETRDVLGIYVEDTRQKLAIFDDLADRLALFLEITNERFLFKTLRVTKGKGFFFESEDGTELPLEALSSGEQHELVLLYQLLFKVDSGSLVLIDEPELSLHVAWQQKFLEDLSRITDIAQFDVLIATHSPQIIHDRWDLTVELKSPSKVSKDSAA